MSQFSKLLLIIAAVNIIEVIPIQLQEGEELKQNDIEESQLNECLSVRRGSEVGVCFGKEILHKLTKFNEDDSFSLANGVSFVRDEKTPRDIEGFLDRDPMDFRTMMEDAGNLISKRSLHWDLSTLYPGLVMRIGPTLANGVLEFVMDPRIKDRTYHQQPHTEMSTGRLLARNLLVPFLLGFKFQLSTLLPLVLGLLLLASKKAFVLAKLALLAVTVFSGGSSLGSYGSSYGGFSGPSLSSYTSYDSPHHHDHHDHHSSGYYHRRPHHAEYYYREKSSEQQSTATPITPDELRDRLERLFVTKKEINDPVDDGKIRNARNFAWTPINTG
ncbi:unnamed protein product [Chilo suppressalis]|uniref:Osiris 10 n=1 Tax=Chilo suppressalis TaxID=168631 RepID=A0ABN8AYR1_CHISP|nr:hypothetical protein evm_011479 [Chilo suppressalis]CAH0401543.1 unnamed protein product [Chilo suppressalis]